MKHKCTKVPNKLDSFAGITQEFVIKYPDLQTDKYDIYYHSTTTEIIFLNEYNDDASIFEAHKRLIIDGYHCFSCNEDVEKYLVLL